MSLAISSHLLRSSSTQVRAHKTLLKPLLERKDGRFNYQSLLKFLLNLTHSTYPQRAQVGRVAASRSRRPCRFLRIDSEGSSRSTSGVAHEIPL
eukprot:762054-Prorocentrum_minimum.AAC.2